MGNGKLPSMCGFKGTVAERDAAKQDVIDYIEKFYNSQRLHSYLC